MRIITFKQLRPEKGVPYSNVHLRRLEAAGLFPKRVAYGPGRVGWIEDEIDAHLRAAIAKRDAASAAA